MIDYRYILVYGDEGLEIIGPFESREALKAWGEKWQAAHDDDPRWQAIHLNDTLIQRKGFADVFNIFVTAP